MAESIGMVRNAGMQSVHKGRPPRGCADAAAGADVAPESEEAIARACWDDCNAWYGCELIDRTCQMVGKQPNGPKRCRCLPCNVCEKEMTLGTEAAMRSQWVIIWESWRQGPLIRCQEMSFEQVLSHNDD